VRAEGGPILLLDALVHDRDGRSVDGSGEVRPRPQALCSPVVAMQVLEFLDMLRPAIELGQFAPEVRACIPHYLLHPFQMGCGEYLVPVLGDENK
jgi:hypothetical protein